jgi:catechol 2,3-dioxygenase-like lactoylglutathione lyase family enzyme
VRVHHVQLAMPPGGEDRARGFYMGVLGMEEIAKPPQLAKRGGCWFRGGDLEIHLGVEEPFSPARKAHPGIAVDDLAELQGRLEAAGYDATADALLPGFKRIYTSDPFGNRIELLEPLDS